MNPEFQRQLWLQFSPTRLGVLPLLLLVGFAAVYLSASTQSAQAIAVALASAGAVLFVALVWGMGTMAAGASVMDEISDRTWDQQRMSAMQPWAMTWGKLAGATAYGWYGGALCLLIAIPGAWLGGIRPFLAHMVLGGILAGIFLHALLMAVNLQLAKSGGKIARRGGAWTFVLVLLYAAGPTSAALRGEDIVWWNTGWSAPDFFVASLAFFTVCTVIGAWRSMAEILAVRQLPWGWPALALFSTAYLSGFAPTRHSAVFAIVGLGTCTAMTYFALLTEPQPRPLWQRVVHRLQADQLRSALLQLPRWPTTLALALPFAVLSLYALNPYTAWPHAVAGLIGQSPVSLVLLIVRDCALALFFAFSVTSRRPVLACMTLMLVLHGLVPWLLGAAGLTLLRGFAQPLLATGATALVAAAVHVLMALGLLRWRWLASTPHAQNQNTPA